MEEILALAQFLPYIMQAITVSTQVVTDLRQGKPIIETLESVAPAVLAILKAIGADKWGHLAPADQVQAAALQTFDKDTVKFVQDALNKLGLATPALVVDGDIGELTQVAIRSFQTDAKVTVDGWPGPETLAALHAAINNLTLPAVKPAA